MLFFDSIKGYLKFDDVWIDNIVFRLHYKATFIIFVTASLFLTSRQFFGPPIACYVDVMSGVPGYIMDTYCWIHSTYSIPTRYAHQTVVILYVLLMTSLMMLISYFYNLGGPESKDKKPHIPVLPLSQILPYPFSMTAQYRLRLSKYPNQRRDIINTISGWLLSFPFMQYFSTFHAICGKQARTEKSKCCLDPCMKTQCYQLTPSPIKSRLFSSTSVYTEELTVPMRQGIINQVFLQISNSYLEVFFCK